MWLSSTLHQSVPYLTPQISHETVLLVLQAYQMSCPRFQSTINGLLFSDLFTEPALVPIHYEIKHGWNKPYHVPHTIEYLRKIAIQSITITEDLGSFQKQPLQNAFELWYCEPSLPDTLRETRSIVATLGGPNVGTWYGPMLVLKQVGNTTSNSRYQNIELGDLRSILPWFRTYGSVANVIYTYLQYSDLGLLSPDEKLFSWYKLLETRPTRNTKMIRGVNILCNGEKNSHSIPRFIEVLVPSDAVIFSHQPAPISTRVGREFIALAQTIPVSNRLSFWYGKNKPAEYIYLDPLTGAVPREWNSSIGNVLVVNADRTDLSPSSVEAYCKFCKDLGRIIAAVSVRDREKIVNEGVTQQEFDRFAVSHRLKHVARCYVYGAFLYGICWAPFYYFWGAKGLIAAAVLTCCWTGGPLEMLKKMYAVGESASSN